MMKKSLQPFGPCLGRDELFVATEYLEKIKIGEKFCNLIFLMYLCTRNDIDYLVAHTSDDGGAGLW
jgi:hypothetical protein